MSATPEEFLGQGPFLEPFSPSVFLDLPPTPRPNGGADDPAANSDDDLVLPFISRMLMEDDIDDKFFYQFPDHPALLNAQEPYAQIISDSTASSSSDSAAATNTTTSGSGNSTLSPSSSSDAPASADPAWPYHSIELLIRSPPYPNMEPALDDDFLTADDVSALFFPGQQDAAAGFQQIPPSAAAAAEADGRGQRQQASSAEDISGGGAGTQSSGAFSNSDAGEEGTEPKATVLPAGDGDHAALASAFFGAQSGDNMDMLNMAFLKGMEEAKKFLPTNSTLLIDLDDDTSAKSLPADSKPATGSAAIQVKEEVVDGMLMFGGRGSSNGRGRKNRHPEEEDLEAEAGRNSKLLMPEQEETGATEMYKEILTCNYEEFVKRMDDLRIAMDSESEKIARRGGGKGARGRQGANEVVDLRTMLIHCAQAVATGDRRSAVETLRQIKRHSSPRGDATQRLAHCFAEGLEARLAGTGSQVYQSLVAQRTSVVDFLRAYKLFMAASCIKKVKFHFAAMTVVDAVAGRSKLHVVEYGLQHGFQWPGLFYFLAKREGGPPEVRLTAIATPQPGFRPAKQMEDAGRRISDFAREFGVPFKFRCIAEKWENVRAKDINIDPDEVLAVNSECFFGNLMDESVLVDSPSPRDLVLSNIREMRPNVFIHSVVNGTYGAPFFLTRFREALFFYSAQFDMLDATIPRDNDERLLIERDMIGRSALNVIACEGADRVDRPETYKQWQVRNHRAGLKQLPLNPDIVKACRDKAKNYYHKDFLIDEDHNWLLEGWKGRVLYAMSAWVAED